MPLPEGYLPRQGDVLIIHATVKYDLEESDDSVHLYPTGSEYTTFLIGLDKIAGLHARKWNKGDLVFAPKMQARGAGEVVATTDDLCWVKFNSGLDTVRANDLAPLPSSPNQEFLRNIAEPLVKPPAPHSNTPTSGDIEEIGF